jgi:hypothetical protein
MQPPTKNHEAGIVLLVVVVLLTLFGVVGLTFAFYASETQCEQNPRVETRGDTCTMVIGTDRR